jgi:two-component system response regulator DegU
MKLLIVEDNRQMRSLLKSLLSNLAETIFECTDGSEALEFYRRHRPDCVLMDIKMESVDGIDATRQIIDAFPTARVIIVTDYDDTELRDAAREAGACDYVVKENLLNLGRILTQWDQPRHLTAS